MKSYIQPMIIFMTAIPFGIVGAILGTGGMKLDNQYPIVKQYSSVE
ncbi:hypothetical protein O9993_06515 [Vibrio lentus]|nr:hypothetical protein [Vibrio lentus]